VTDTSKSIVIVTGGGSGIGRAVCHSLQGDFETVAVDRSGAAARATADQVGGWSIEADLSRREDNEHVVAQVVGRYGKLNALVLCAGIARGGSALTISEADWHATMNVNLNSGFWMCRSALPHLGGGGRIVGISSLSALRVGPNSAAYAVSKAAFAMLMQSIAIDFGSAGVRANAICPGWIRTPMADHDLSAYAQNNSISIEEGYERATSVTPVRRAGQPDEVAAMVRWMLSPSADYLNGAVIPFDGGVSALDPGTSILACQS